MASAVAIAVEKPFSGGHDSLGDATQLHQSIIASGLRGPVYISPAPPRLSEDRTAAP